MDSACREINSEAVRFRPLGYRDKEMLAYFNGLCG